VINRVGDSMGLGREELRPQVDASSSTLQQNLVAWWRLLETQVADHPKESLLAAVSMGVLLGWITKRH
jgi:hypothetical protein